MSLKNQHETAVRRILEQVRLCPEPRSVARQLLQKAERDAQAVEELISGQRDLDSIDVIPLPAAPNPRVGAVAYDSAGEFLGAARRGEQPAKPNAHAEYNLLEKIEKGALVGGELYTSLEPCTPNARSTDKTACVLRVIAARPRRVLVGMLDPNKEIRGQAVYMLQRAGIAVELFDPTELRQLNADFVNYFETVSDVGSIALSTLRQICHHLWIEARDNYRDGHARGSQASELRRSIGNCERAARCFGFADFWLQKRARLEPWFHYEQRRDGIPSWDEMTKWATSWQRYLERSDQVVDGEKDERQ